LASDGHSANSSGRPPGTSAVAELRAGIAARVPEILERLTAAALSGDVPAARLLLERVLPPVKAVELPIDLALTPDGRPTEQARQVLAAAAGGAITPDQAVSLIGALAVLARITKTDELRERIERLEAAKS
jgi:hypothetical protein